MFIFWKNPQLDNLLSKLTDLYQNIIFIYESKKQKIGCEIEGKQKFKNEFIKTLSPCYCSVCKHKSMIVHIGYLPIFQIHTQSTWYFCEPFLTHLFEALLLIYFSNQYIEGKYPEPRFSLVPALVTQPTLQRWPNPMELRSMDSYFQILCHFQKCKQKVPPPSLLQWWKTTLYPLGRIQSTLQHRLSD